MTKKIYKRNVCVRGPDRFSEIKITNPKPYAAGKEGIAAAMKHSFKEMGVFRAMSTLLHMNQKDGFDCPSCAWPDPEKPSRIGEYCENGAKALADEATRSTIGAGFFAKYSVEELSLRTDYELNALGRLTEPLVLREGSIHYAPISWKDAYTLIADNLHRLKSPDKAIFYKIGRAHV